MSRLKDLRAEDGTLPAYAWPGGYPMIYVCEDGGVLCPACANGENGSEASERATDSQWRLVDGDVHWEGDPEVCEHCGAEVASAYGGEDEP